MKMTMGSTWKAKMKPKKAQRNAALPTSPLTINAELQRYQLVVLTLDA